MRNARNTWRALARMGHLVFYITPRTGYDAFAAVHEIEPNLVISDQIELVREHVRHPAIMLLSTDNRIDGARLADLRRWSPRIIYDYIDHIDPAISMGPVPPSHIEAHQAMLEDPSILVVATAQVLFDDAANQRGTTKNLVLSTNGVDIDHFAVSRAESAVSGPLGDIVAARRPIAGYFGALATWFDYDLVAACARLRPDIAFVLIGPDYDGSAAAWRAGAGGSIPANLHFLPPIPYPRLPPHAVWFDVALVPFRLNDITLATSPLKLFEYMAMGLPVISTPLPECRKHDCVLIAATPEAFAARIDEALRLRDDPDHRAALRREAEVSSWAGKARIIVNAVVAMEPGAPAC